ncbi:hypothetical protein KPL47_16615 [Clostridium estertheticum]|uniref:hypothetical protein n=1 Tax=Clostridium estertheticum TaxID=238834 RepID=UPI001C0DEA02|nr:hypothetical protein [Clostridium estertheticum]MBU3177955.1 hypothetical protein [Clostridium estertheticum]
MKLIETTLKESMESGVLRNDINLNLISSILESVSNTFLDYKFLSKNNMTMKDAMNETITILLHGILKI